MRRQWFYILLSLAGEDRHGSAIARDVLEITGGELTLWPVTLYGSLDDLAEQGWIRRLDAPPPDADDDSARRRWYRITPQGRRALAAEAARLRRTLRLAQRRLGQAGQAL